MAGGFYPVNNSLISSTGQNFVNPNPNIMNGMQFGSWNNSYITAGPKNSSSLQNTGIIWVNGVEGAKGYIIQPNSSVVLMDSEQDYFYLKTANDAGIASIRVFEFKEKQQNNINTNINIEDQLKNYVSKEEFERLQNTLNDIINLLNNNISVVNNSISTETKEISKNKTSNNKYIEKKEG